MSTPTAEDNILVNTYKESRENSQRSRAVSLTVIDTGYPFINIQPTPQFTAAYLVGDDSGYVLIETGVNQSVPTILAAIDRVLPDRSLLKAIVVTHVHLDHVGGLSQLHRLFPQAKIFCHERAAKHIIDPTKLIASAKGVYGDTVFERLYGLIHPISAENVCAVTDNEKINISNNIFSFLYTKGHANHHLVVQLHNNNSMFTGDTFGLYYPALQLGRPEVAPFIFASTSPTDFSYAEAIVSVDRIVASGVEVVYPTHFGPVTMSKYLVNQLKDHLHFSKTLYENRHLGEAALLDQSYQYFRKALYNVDETTWRAVIDLDIRLNVQGVLAAK